jgi:hypothetical protein
LKRSLEDYFRLPAFKPAFFAGFAGGSTACHVGGRKFEPQQHHQQRSSQQ